MNGFFAAGCAAMFAVVAAGAFGAHALKSRLTPEMLAVWETAVRYMAYHGLALLLVGRMPQSRVAGWCFTLGIVVFSGSLFLLALTGKKWLGAITPLGGLAFLAGWLSLLLSSRP